jgi:hypothetical protein
LLPRVVAQIDGRDWPGRWSGRKTHLFGEDFRLINNRQSGRRRGRGGGGGRQQSGPPGPGNRQDNRQRGNAAQLLEKYKSMARDAQMGGDRVQTEYYLQYAEHYYRVLNENRARFEEQRPQRGDFYEDDDQDQDQDEGVSADGRDDGDDRSYRDERPMRDDRPLRDDRPMRDDRPQRQERSYRDDRDAPGDRDARGDERSYRSEQPPQRADNEERRPRVEREARNGDAPRGRGRPRRDRFESEDEGGERIALDVLPPAIAPLPLADPAGEGDEGVKPRRRARRPRDEGETEIAPAA